MSDSVADRLSNSKLKTWRRCPKKFEFKYVQGLRPKSKAVQLERGSWLHDLLMHHYDGEDWRDRHAVLEGQFLSMFEEEREELGDLNEEVARIMRNYLRHYRHEDQDLRIVDSEMDEMITLPNGLRFQMVIDLVTEEDGGLVLWDHKTVKDFMPEDFMLLDAQLTRYFVGAKMLGYTPLKGVMFNELRTKPPTVPELVDNGRRLTRRKNISTDFYTYLEAIKRNDLDPQDYRDVLRRLRASDEHRWFRRTLLPRDRPMTRQMMAELVMGAREIRRAERTNEFPRSVEKSCRWDCEFLDPCVIQLMGGDISDVIKRRYEVKEVD